MHSTDEDSFMVILRTDPPHTAPRDEVEHVVEICPTYQEARQIRQVFHNAGHNCVIRYLGQAGGGD
jgi:hypothetical protein